jgi:broad specificity phosphatase PhoE
MQLSIILFRHGKIQSEKNIFCGWLNLPLNEEGLNQANALAQKLKGEKIDLAFCSDQLRSQQALLEVLKFHPKAKVIVDPRLRERHYGSLSGSLKEVVKKKSKKKFDELHRGYYAVIPSGENMHKVSKRVFPFMSDLIRLMQRKKCCVAISAHTNSLRLIQEYLEGLFPHEAEKLEHHPEEYKKYVIDFEK